MRRFARAALHHLRGQRRGVYLRDGTPLAAGKDVLCIAFSSGLSNTYNAAAVAVQELSQKYPERKIYAVDSLCASLGQGLLVYLAAQERAKGKGIEEVRDWLETEKFHLCHWFTVEDLQFLKRGGRVSAATALVGTMLSIKPVMHMDNAGHLINVSKARGRRASLTALVDRMEQLAIAPEEQTVFISHGDSLEDAQFVAGRSSGASASGNRWSSTTSARSSAPTPAPAQSPYFSSAGSDND